jgi:HYDIN/CFA65/VesB-like, Ig-like domain
VIKNKTDKNLKSRALSYARRARSACLVQNVLTLFVGVALVTITSSASPLYISNASPELVIDSTRRDFGEVFVGEEIDQVFTVRNVGTSPLELGIKTVTARSSAASQGQLISASGRLDPVINYLKPAAAIKRLAAPT